MSASSGQKNTPEPERREHHENASQKNRVTNKMEGAERLISGTLGGTLLIRGLTRKPLPRLALGATTAPFLYRGAICHCRVHESLVIGTHRDALNSNHSSNQSYEPTGLEESIEKKRLPLTPRRKQTAKAIIRRKGIVRAATVSFA